MEHMSVKKQIINCAERAGVSFDDSINNEDFDLREYVADSLQFINFIIEIENEFNIEIPPYMLLFDNLTSINSFCYMINELLENSN